MTLSDCPDCPGRTCPAYIAQHDREGMLGLRVAVELGLTAREGWVHDTLRAALGRSELVRDDDVFEIHVMPGEGDTEGFTEYFGLLANRENSLVGAE